MAQQTESTIANSEQSIPLILTIGAVATILSANTDLYTTIAIFSLATLIIYISQSYLDLPEIQEKHELKISPLEGLSMVCLLFVGAIFYITSQVAEPIFFLSIYLQIVNRII